MSNMLKKPCNGLIETLVVIGIDQDTGLTIPEPVDKVT